MNIKGKIEELNLSKKITCTLKENKIYIIEDIWKLKRKNLKDLGLTDAEINQIIIKLELLGIGLNNKIYKFI